MKKVIFFILLMWLVLGRAFGQDRIDWDQIKAAPGSNYIPRSNVSGDGVWTAINAILSGANSVYGTGSAGLIAEWLNDSTLTFDATGAYQLSVGTDAQRPTGATGLIRYNTTANNLEWYSGTAWENPVESSVPSGMFTAGSVLYADANGRAAQDNANFRYVSGLLLLQKGTTNVAIGTNTNTAAGFTSGSNNVVIGQTAGRYMTTGQQNVAIGLQAGQGAAAGNTASNNISIGALANSSITNGGSNVSVGASTGQALTSGQQNVNIGFQAGQRATTGQQNVNIGQAAGQGASSGTISYTGNVNVGTAAGAGLTSGQYNNNVGNSAGTAITTGTYNNFQGFFAGGAITTGSYNSSLGFETLRYTTDVAGGYSTAIGAQALHRASEIDNAIAIGRNAADSNSYANVLVIGYDADATAANQITIGSSQYTTARFPITGAVQVASGTTAQRPSALVGQFRNNTDSTNAEYYANGAWRQIASRDWARSTFALAAAGYTGWTLAGDSGTQSIASGNTATFTGGWGIVTAASATDVLTITADSSEVATQYDIRGVLSGSGNASPSYGLDWGSYTGAWRLPNGTTAQRPTNAAGLLRWNTSTPGLEVGDGSTWTAIGNGIISALPVGNVSITSGSNTLTLTDGSNTRIMSNQYDEYDTGDYYGYYRADYATTSYDDGASKYVGAEMAALSIGRAYIQVFNNPYADTRQYSFNANTGESVSTPARVISSYRDTNTVITSRYHHGAITVQSASRSADQQPTFSLSRLRTTSVLETNDFPASADKLGQVIWTGRNDSTNQSIITKWSARIYAEATQTHTASAYGSKLVLATTANGATTSTDRLTIDQDGTAIFEQKIRLGGSSGPIVLSGSGSPESVVTAPVGSLYMRTDGGAGTTLYVKESGTGNTGWIAK